MEEWLMPDKWMTVAAAAATLNVHPRTIERRIASGKIESRRTDDGQLQVLINAPDEPSAGVEAFETVKELAQDQVSLATGSASALVKFAQQDAERARTELDLVRQDAGRARQNARFAWIAVAAMSVGVCVAVGWTTHKLTRSSDDIKTLTQQADAIQRDADKLRTERENARKDAQEARIEAAQTAGQLQVMTDQQMTLAEQQKVLIDQQKQSANRPTTRPTTLIGRLAGAFVNE
jgi:excisionase family DNA binding protein